MRLDRKGYNMTINEQTKLKDLVYKITDINEVCIRALEDINNTDSNNVVTVLKCNRDKLNQLLDMIEE